MSDIILSQILSGYNLAEVNRNFQIIQDTLNKLMLRKDGENAILSGNLDVNGQTLLNVGDLEINGVSVLDGVNQIEAAYSRIVDELDDYSHKLQDIINKTIEAGAVDRNHTNNVQATWTLPSVAAIGSTLTLPYHYTVGKNTLRLSYNNIYSMYKGTDYEEVGDIGEQSNQITIKGAAIPVGARMEMWVEAGSEMIQILEAVIEAKDLLETYNTELINNFLTAVSNAQNAQLETKLVNATSAANDLASQTSNANTLKAEIQSMINNINSQAQQCATYYTQISSLYGALMEFQRGGIDLTALNEAIVELGNVQDDINTAMSTTTGQVTQTSAYLSTAMAQVEEVSAYKNSINSVVNTVTKLGFTGTPTEINSLIGVSAPNISSMYRAAASNYNNFSVTAGIAESTMRDLSSGVMSVARLVGSAQSSTWDLYSTVLGYTAYVDRQLSSVTSLTDTNSGYLNEVNELKDSTANLAGSAHTDYLHASSAALDAASNKTSVEGILEEVEGKLTSVKEYYSAFSPVVQSTLSQVSSTYSTVSTNLTSLVGAFNSSIGDARDDAITSVNAATDVLTTYTDTASGYVDDANEALTSANAVLTSVNALSTTVAGYSTNVGTMSTNVANMSANLQNTIETAAAEYASQAVVEADLQGAIDAAKNSITNYFDNVSAGVVALSNSYYSNISSAHSAVANMSTEITTAVTGASSLANQTLANYSTAASQISQINQIKVDAETIRNTVSNYMSSNTTLADNIGIMSANVATASVNTAAASTGAVTAKNSAQSIYNATSQLVSGINTNLNFISNASNNIAVMSTNIGDLSRNMGNASAQVEQIAQYSTSVSSMYTDLQNVSIVATDVSAYVDSKLEDIDLTPIENSIAAVTNVQTYYVNPYIGNSTSHNMMLPYAPLSMVLSYTLSGYNSLNFIFLSPVKPTSFTSVYVNNSITAVEAIVNSSEFKSSGLLNEGTLFLNYMGSRGKTAITYPASLLTPVKNCLSEITQGKQYIIAFKGPYFNIQEVGW